MLNLLPVRWWLLLSLGVRRPAPMAGGMGIGGSSSGSRPSWHCHGLGIVLFFVNSRYRIPMWPAMAILAGGALPWLAERWRRQAWGKLAGAAVMIGALAVASLNNWLGIPPQGYGRDFFFRSFAHLQKGDLEAAEADGRRSVELDPGDAAAQFQLGNTALDAGHLEVPSRATSPPPA